VPRGPGFEVWSFENPGVEIVADLLGDQAFELRAVFGDEGSIVGSTRTECPLWPVIASAGQRGASASVGVGPGWWNRLWSGVIRRV
jgi:hypothetical protein